MSAIPKSTFGKILTIVILLLMLALALFELLDKPGIGNRVKSWLGWEEEPPLTELPPPPPPKPYDLTLEVNRSDKTYLRGEEIEVTVKSDRAGHLYLFQQTSDGKWYCLIPSRKHPATTLAADQPVKLNVPVQPPFGPLLFRAVVADLPLTGKERALLPKEPSAFMTQEELDKVLAHFRGQDPSDTTSWGEQRIEVITDSGE